MRDTYHLAGRIQDCRCEGPAQQTDQPQHDYPHRAIVELQQARQHSPRQEAACQVHEVRVQQPCTRSDTHAPAAITTSVYCV